MDVQDSTMQSQYEFTVDQNKLFAVMAKKTRIISYLFFGFAILLVIGFVLSLKKIETSNMIFDVILFFVFAAIGTYNLKVSTEFEKIVKTEGNDIALLMGAIASLKTFYTVQIWLFGAVFVIAVLTRIG